MPRLVHYVADRHGTGVLHEEGEIVVDSEEIRRLVNKWGDDIYARGDLDAGFEIWASDGVYEHPPSPPAVGAVAVRQTLEALRQAFTEQQVQVHSTVVEGDKAVVYWTWGAVHSGQSRNLPVPPSGKRISMDGISLFEFRNGKVVRLLEFSDTLGLMQQLGALPPMG